MDIFWNYTLLHCGLNICYLTVAFYCITVNKFHPTQISGSLYQRVIFQRNAVVPFTFYHLVTVLFCIGLSVGVTIAVGLLLFYQVQLIVSMRLF